MKYSNYSLEKLIPIFISKRCESDIWDFKQEWHANIHELIKDIVCFANTIHDEDCYLIFGITDDFKVLGLSGKRYKQSDILDALSKIRFAGDIKPEINLHTLRLPSDFADGEIADIDVLVIKNTYSTPLFLTKCYGKMAQGCVYSRTGDKNTPDMSNSDSKQIEMLWKKRLGLTKSPLEYIIDRLHNKTEWNQYNEVWYNIYKPEYCLRIISEEEIQNSDEFYSFSQTNENTMFQTLEIVANNTVLTQYQTVCLDGGRLLIPVPEHGFLNIYNEDDVKYSYRYYLKDSNRYSILSFLYDNNQSDEKYAFENLSEVVIIFQNNSEKESFHEYILMNADILISRLKNCNRYEYINTGDLRKNDIYKFRLRTGIVLNEMLLKYRTQKAQMS